MGRFGGGAENATPDVSESDDPVLLMITAGTGAPVAPSWLAL
jgi:hypothetical protein